MNTSLILLLALTVSVGFVGINQAYANTYFAAYPDVTKRDPTYVYQTCDFGPTTSTIDKDVYCIVSSAGQTVGNAHSGYMMQNFVEYRNLNDHLYFNSEAWGINKVNNVVAVRQAYDCETGNGCTDLGTETSIDKVNTIQFWSGGVVRFFAEKVPTTGVSTGHYNTNYSPAADDASVNFQSGKDTITNGPILKLTQWGIEGPSDAVNFTIDQSGMFTWSPTQQFGSDLAKTVDPVNTAGHGSQIIYRVIDSFGYTGKVGDTKYCVDRTNTVAGLIVWEDTTTNCESAGTTFWS